MEKTKNNSGVPLAIELRKKNYEDYLGASNGTVNPEVGSTISPHEILRDLASYQKDSYKPALDTDDTLDESRNNLSTYDLITNSVAASLRAMNEAQLANTQGILRREVLPQMDRIKSNINLFETYNGLVSQRNNLLNHLAVSQDDAEISQIQNELSNIDSNLYNTREALMSLGVSPDMSNISDIREKQEADLKSYQNKANELYADIETDEADIERYKVDSRFEQAMSENQEFKWTEPSKWIYTVPQAVGSSSSAWLWQVAPYASTALRSVFKKAISKAAIGAASGAIAGSVVPGAGTAAGGTVGGVAAGTVGAISAALDVANAGMLLYSNYKQAENEANANVADDYRDRVTQLITSTGLTISNIADEARANGLDERYARLSDDKIFEKILDGQIESTNPILAEAQIQARQGLDRDFAQNMSITYASNLASDVIMLPYFGKIADGWLGKTIKKGALLSDPIEAIGDKAADAAKKTLSKYILGRNAIDKATRSWASRAAKAAYIGGDLAVRNLATSFNEALEEGAQYTTGAAYKRGDFDDSDLNLEGLASSLFGAYKEKGRTLANILGSPFGYQDALYENDSEYWNNVKLGAAASLLSPMQVGVNARGAYSLYKETKGMDKVNELAVGEINTKEDMSKAVTYASGKFKGVESEVVNAWANLAEGPTENLPEGFTSDDALEEAQFASRVFTVAKSDRMKDLAENLGIEQNTEEFGNLVGLYMQAEKDFKASLEDLTDKNQQLTNRAQALNSNAALATQMEKAVDNAFNTINDNAQSTDQIVSKDEIRELFKLQEQQRVLDNMLSEVNNAVEIVKSTSNPAELRGNEYTLAKLEDMRYRLQARKKSIDKAMPSWYKNYTGDKTLLNNQVASVGAFNEVTEYENAIEDRLFSEINAERNQEIYNAFNGIENGAKITPTEASQRADIITEAKEKKTPKKRRNLKLKALRNIHNAQGEKLIDEMLELYQAKKEQSREMMEGTTGVTEQQTVNKPVVPSKPVTVPTGTVTEQPAPTVEQVKPVTPTKPIKPVKPSKPRRTISASELDEADAALIAAAEGQDIGLGTPTVQPAATAAPSSIDTTDTEKEKPVVNNDILSSDEDPFAGGFGDPTGEGVFDERGGEAVEVSKPSKAAKAKQDAQDAKAKFNKSVQDFFDLLDDNSVGFAFDPAANAEKQAKIFVAFLKLLGNAFNLGAYKFKEVALNMYEAIGNNREKLTTHFDSIKGAYTTAYYQMPEEDRARMSSPQEVAAITVDDLFDTPVSDLTESQVEEATQAGVLPTPQAPEAIPTDAITDNELKDFSEDSRLGILNTFHYKHDAQLSETITFANGNRVTFSLNTELPELFRTRLSDLSFEYSVAPFIHYKTNSTKVKWNNPATYDWARVGMIITDSKTGKKYWLAMRSPNNLRVGDTSEEYNTLINDLRAARADIISRFVVKDSNGNLTNAIDYNIKVTPTRTLIHNAVEGISKYAPINDAKFNNILQLSTNLDEELDNFGYSTGVRSAETIYTIHGDNTGFTGTTSGGVYYIIAGNKRLSGRPLPLKISTVSYNNLEELANLLSTIVFKSGFSSYDKIGNTDLIGSDLIKLFLNYGEATQVKDNSDISDAAAKNLRNKQLYVDNSGVVGKLVYGNNSTSIAGLTSDQRDKERKAFVDWLMKEGSMPFKVPSKNNDVVSVDMKLRDLFQGRLASSVEKANGRLELVPGVVFTKDDLDHSLLAWMIKNGMLKSNLNAERYERPFVIADGITQDAPTNIPNSTAVPTVSEPQVEQPTVEEKPAPTRKRRTFRDLNTFGGSETEVRVNFTPKKTYTSKEKMNKVQARNFLKEKLGMSDAEIDIIDVAVSSDMPATALSHMTQDAIHLYSSDPAGVEYHEAYHRVSLLLMSEQQRNKVYDSYKASHENMKNASNKQVEEALAEDFRKYMLENVPSKVYRITKWFNKLIDFVYSLVGKIRPTSIFRGIYEGKYANVPVTQEAKDRFVAAYGDRVNFTQHGHEFQNIKSLDSYFQAVDYFTTSYVSQSMTTEDIVDDLSRINIDYNDMREFLEDLSYDEAATPEQRAAAKELFDNFSIFKQDVQSKLAELSLKQIKEEQEYEETEERDGGEIEKDNFDKYDKASYEVSILHNIRPAVKLFLSSIEDRVYNTATKTYTRDINPETGIPRVTPFMAAWRRIVDKLFDEDSYGGLIRKAAQLSKTDPFFASVYNRLSKIKDSNLQTQIFQTITGFRHNFLTVGYQDVGTNEVMYISNLGGSVNVRNGKRIVSDWNRNFYNSEFMITDEQGNRKPDMAKLKELRDELTKATNELAKLTDSSTNEDLSQALYKLLDIYNKIGISITYDTLFQAIVDKVSAINSVNKPTILQAAKDLLTSNRDGSLAKAIPEILRRPVKDKPSDRIKRTADAIFTGENSILNLAIVHYQLNNNNLEEKVLGPKNTTVYPLSKHNYITLEIKKLNNDRSYVNKLLKCPINSSSIVYNQLKSNPNTRLTVGTLLNITEYNSGNTGTDYQSAPKVETFISKFTLSENDILVLPTMSDKKTYMPIQGLRLFKDRTMEIVPLDGELSIRMSKDVIEQFYKYYKSEYDAILQYRRMKLAEDQIDDANRPTMYFGKKGKDTGKGGKFRIARGVWHTDENGNTNYIDFNSLSDQELMDTFNNVAQLKEDINTTLIHRADEQLKYVQKLGLIEQKKSGLWSNKFLPVSSINERSNNYANTYAQLSGSQNKMLRENLAIMDAIWTFTVNHFVSMFETEKVIYKDVAFFKNYPDVSKRLAGTLSTGDRPRLDFTDPNHIMNKIPRYKNGRYNVAGLKDIETHTNQPKELYKAIYRAYVRELMENDGNYTKEFIDNVFESDDLFSHEDIPQAIKDKAKTSTERDLKLYGDITMDKEGNITINTEDNPINQADASVYCSPTMYKAILATQGLLDAETEAAIDYVEEHADDLGDVRKYINTLAAVMSPKKMVYFGNEILEPLQGEFINMPIFNKMAIFPLFKVLATGDLKALYDRMNDTTNPIDMFTTKSAVKVGNIVEYDFYTDTSQSQISEEFTKDENGSYNKPITFRQQSFGNLLNQMPIEAHEAEKRMLVTQAMKTVYSNIRLDGDYYLPNGKKLSGRELRDYAMRAIDNLSDRGLNRLLKDLHAVKNEDGTFTFKDLQGISDSLVRDLIASNTDSDIVNQVALNERGEFNVPISASPLSKQLVTKLISKVNKETVDINLPGGTFVQMSSFGMKSIDKLSQAEAKQDYSKYMVNEGRKLMLKNENNSMDCVISINLLKHIIPGYDNMSFLEARQWLIDNHIIGDNASPSSMAYRVPTQGMSSIAALTIRDVVMSQAGDVIILPDEFTARTGSDFDIDKLFLTRYNYTTKRSNKLGRNATNTERENALKGYDAWADEVLAIRNGEPVTRRNSMKASEAINEYLESKNSNVRYDNTDGNYKVYEYVTAKTEYNFDKPMSENSQGAVENLLIDTFMASLLDPKNVHDTTRPLDVPVNIMKKGIVEVYFPDVKNNQALFEYTEAYQDNLKQDFADSKSGIGPFALNNPHHVLGQLVELVMQAPEYMPKFGNLHRVSGVDDIHILDWLSALISAHVDVAKDNYIIKLNVNTFTYNVTNLLLRSGAGKNTMYFVSQEIMKRMAQDYIQSKGTYAIDSTKSFQSRYNEKEKAILEEFTKKANQAATNKIQRDAITNLLNNDKLSCDELFEIPEVGKLGYLENLLRKANEKEKDFDYYYGQLLVYKMYKQIDPMARALSDLVKASQVDTKKFGKNAIEMRQFLDKIADVQSSPYFTPEMIDKFYKDTFLQKKIDNSIIFTLNLLGNINIQSKDKYYNKFRSFVNASGLATISNKQAITAITNAIDSFWRSTALYADSSSPLINSMRELNRLFIGTDSIAKRLNRLKKDILADKANNGNKYPMISVTNGRISNLFLNSITGVTDTTNKGIDYIRLDYSDDINSNASRQIREYWQELLDSNVPELHDFAYDLIRYAVFSGTGIKHLNSLFDFIPQRALEEIGYFDAVRNIEDDTVDFDLLFTKEDIDEIYRNNWQNDTLVPTVNLTRKGIYKLTAVVRGKLTNVAFKGSDKRALCKNLEGISIYHPYVKVRNNRSTGNFDLYKYIGTFVKDDGKQIIEKPVYILVNKKGYREGGKGMVTEYLSKWVVGETASRYSIIPGNNVAPSYSNYGGNFLEDVPELINNNVIPKLNSQTNDVTKAGLDGVFHPASSIDYMFGLDGNNNDIRYQLNEEMSEDGEVEQASEVRPNTTKTPIVPTTKIISGGQTGIDRLGLEIGKELGLETGGTTTPGYYTENGPDTSLQEFGVTEIAPELQAGKKGKEFYLPRTRQNVINSDGTVYFSTDEDSAGRIATQRFAKAHNKPFLLNPTSQELAQWLVDNNIGTLNVAGNRGSKVSPEFDSQVRETIRNAFKSPTQQDLFNEFNNTKEFSTDEMNHCIKS